MRNLGSAIWRSSAVAAALTLVLSQTVVGVQWGDPQPITESGYAGLNSTATSSPNRVHVVYTDYGSGSLSVWYRRSGNGGATWSTPFQISRPGAYASDVGAINRAGTSTLDVVWLEYDVDHNVRVWYRHSLNNGFSWADPIRLTPLVGDVGDPDVARFGDRVIVTYTDGETGKLYVRIRTHGGATFGARQEIGTTVNQPYPGSATYEGYPAVIDASGTITVVWDGSATTLRTRRSTDGGSVWRDQATLATNATGTPPTILSARAKIVVGYASRVDGQSRATHRRSFNEGARWKAALLIGGVGSGAPIFGYGGGLLRAAYPLCADSACTTQVPRFRVSVNFGGSWSKASTVSLPSHQPYAGPVGVGAVAGGTVVIYGYTNVSRDSFLFARVATP